jgi:hypothetical protein
MAGEGLRGALGTPEVGGELGALLCYERGLATQPLLEALLERRGGGHPPEVRQAADRLLQTQAPWALDLVGSATMLVECAGDERRVRLFRGWALGGQSLEELARQEGIARQGASWNAHRAEALVRQAAAAAPPWPWLVSTARRGLGAVTSREKVDAVLVRLGVTTAPEAELLRWLAGPYHPVPKRPGWLAVDPRQVVGRTVDCLANDGGVRRLPDVEGELADLEIAPDQLSAWLGANGSTVVHELAVLVTGSLADAVERVLDAHGTARTAPEVEADLAAGGRVVESGALDRALRTRRFTRSAKGAIRLADWGADDRRSTKKAPRRPARLDRTKPRRTEAEQAPAAEGRLWLWVRVDDEVLRGSEAAVPAALVEGLGLSPLARRTFSSRWGPVTLAHDAAQPTRGSVRAIALAAGANPDDTLLLGFSAAGDVAVEVRRGPGQISPTDAGAAPLVLFPEFEFVNGGTP